MEKTKKIRSLKQIENTKKLVERNRLKSIETKKQKENGTYVKPIRKKKIKKEIAILKTPELVDIQDDKDENITDDTSSLETQNEELLDYENSIPGYEHLFKKN